MQRVKKILSVVAGLTSLTGIVAFTPYSIQGVPEWKLQILDTNGQPAAGVDVQQEWIDPDSEGEGTPTDTQTSDSKGFVVFREHRLRNRLASGKPSTASAHVYVCWKDQHGQLYWSRPNPLPAVLKLEMGPACPYS